LPYGTILSKKIVKQIRSLEVFYKKIT